MKKRTIKISAVIIAIVVVAIYLIWKMIPSEDPSLKPQELTKKAATGSPQSKEGIDKRKQLSQSLKSIRAHSEKIKAAREQLRQLNRSELHVLPKPVSKETALEDKSSMTVEPQSKKQMHHIREHVRSITDNKKLMSIIKRKQLEKQNEEMQEQEEN